jgi:GT2 family glycosyltransferase
MIPLTPKKLTETVVIIPNFNGLEHLEECLTSLASQSYRDFVTLVIDDGSTDNSLNYLKEKWPQIEILALAQNLGFAKAVNLGICHALEKYHPAYIAILNNDTKADPNWLKNLVGAIESEEDLVAVASNMLYYDHPEIINSQGGKFTLGGYGLDINFNKKQSEITTPPKYVLASCWGATLIKSRALQTVGLLDENYYSYFEDLDWGYRANLLGYKIIFEPQAIVYHKGSATWGKYPFKKSYLCRKNSIYTILKNYELKNIFKALPLIFFDYFVLYPIGQLIKQRFKFLIIPIQAWWWNLKNLSKTLETRKKIQLARKISDKEIFKLSQNL